MEIIYYNVVVVVEGYILLLIIIKMNKPDIEGTVRMARRIAEWKEVIIKEHNECVIPKIKKDVYVCMNSDEHRSDVINVYFMWLDSRKDRNNIRLEQYFIEDNNREWDDDEELNKYMVKYFFKNVYNNDIFEEAHEYIQQFKGIARKNWVDKFN